MSANKYYNTQFGSNRQSAKHTNKSETSKKVTTNYYELLKRNKEAFEISEKEDNTNEVTTTSKRGSSNAKNITKILKECLKLKTKFTDIEMDNINKIIDLLENGELPSRIIKDGNREIKKMTEINDIAKFYKEFEQSIPKVYFEQESKATLNKKKLSSNEKEIILSEYFA